MKKLLNSEISKILEKKIKILTGCHSDHRKPNRILPTLQILVRTDSSDRPLKYLDQKGEHNHRTEKTHNQKTVRLGQNVALHTKKQANFLSTEQLNDPLHLQTGEVRAGEVLLEDEVNSDAGKSAQSVVHLIGHEQLHRGVES